MEEDTRHKIEIALDSPYSQEFADWLNENGRVAFVGRTTEKFINGVCTADDDHADKIMRELREEFRMEGINVG